MQSKHENENTVAVLGAGTAILGGKIMESFLHASYPDPVHGIDITQLGAYFYPNGASGDVKQVTQSDLQQKQKLARTKFAR